MDVVTLAVAVPYSFLTVSVWFFAFMAHRALRKAQIEFVEFKTTLNELFMPDGEEAPPAIQFVDMLVDRQMGRFKMQALGEVSGEARRDNREAEDGIEAALSMKNPMLVTALNKFFPRWKRLVRQNPGMVGQLEGLLHGNVIEGAAAGQAGTPAQNGNKKKFDGF